jgi:AcrR family transcriptional regulator
VAATSEAAHGSRPAQPPEARYDKLSPGPGMTADEVASHQRTRLHGAVIEIAGEQGYGEVTVREVSRLAGVSTRAFYAHFQDKDDCVLRTYELVVQRATARIVGAQSGEQDWLERMRRAFEAFAHEVEYKPRGARLAVEPYAIGPVALEETRRTEGTFERMIAESLSWAPDAVEVPPLLIKGMVAGIARVARIRLLRGREHEMATLASPLQRWALSLRDVRATELCTIDGRVSTRAAVPSSPSVRPAQGNGLREDDRILILKAVAKLAASQGYDQLTVPRIRSAAGVPRRAFNAHFDGVRDCFLASVEERADFAVNATWQHLPGDDWAIDVCAMICRLCNRIASDPLLARIAFADVFAPGLAGLLCREEIVTKIARSFIASSNGDKGPSELAAEASVGAVWAVIQHYVLSGKTQELPRLAPTLSYLALAPAIGAPAAMDAIRGKQEHR